MLQRFPLAALEVRVTEPPMLKLVGPEALIVGAGIEPQAGALYKLDICAGVNAVLKNLMSSSVPIKYCSGPHGFLPIYSCLLLLTSSTTLCVALLLKVPSIYKLCKVPDLVYTTKCHALLL